MLYPPTISRLLPRAVAFSLLPTLALAGWLLQAGAFGPLAVLLGCVLPAVGVPLVLLRRAREEAACARADRDDDIDTLSYSVSHDLRAPVQVIRGFADAVLSGQVGTVDDAARQVLDRVRRNAARMDELMTDLLALARLSRETLRCERFDPLALASDVVDEVRHRYPGRVIECRASGSVELVADRRLVRVMIDSLVDNAAKFSPAAPVCQLELRSRCERDEVVLEVCDRGVGFPNELAPRLFRPFQRLHPDERFAGNGVGLARAARIARLHGGTIGGRNRPGGGAVFEIRMPQRHTTEAQ
jgi:signal transduction histidine kinase